MLRRILATAALGLGVFAPAAIAAPTTLNIIPHGQGEPGATWVNESGMLPADTQAKMYDRLTSLYRTVGDAQLVPSTDGSGYFKSAALVPENDPSLIYSKVVSGVAPGVGNVSATIKRDAYGVPHIYSSTDAGAIFGAGWVVADDRSLLLNQARYNGIASLIDMPGVSGIQLVLGLYSYKPTQKVIDQVTKQQTDALNAAGTQGKQVLSDMDTYLAGINLWYSENQPTAPKFTRTDIFAVNGIKAQYLGQGGGDEIGNAQMLDGLRSKFGSKSGNGIWSDLRGINDPETNTTTSNSFPWQTSPSLSNMPGNVVLKNGSFKNAYVKVPGASTARSANQDLAEATPTDAHPKGIQHKASNIMILSGDKSASGFPEFVGGPQIGYNYPGLTIEEQISSPSINVRGATSAPFPGYMLIGRGADYAWTLTSADGDIIDTYAEKLCGGSDRKYSYKGKCKSMEKVDAGTITKGGVTTNAVFYRTVHGPVVGYATSRSTGKKVALAQRRSDVGQETTDQLFNQQMTFGRVKSAADFVAAAKKTPQTFNSFYASKTESAFYTSGKLPLQPKGARNDLPIDGTGKYEWKGYLAKSQQPHVINPSSGMITNWNGKPAKNFPASDSRWAEQSLQRVDMLNAELARKSKNTLADVLNAANAGATEDIRIARFWPTLKAMLDKGTSPSRAATSAYDLLQQWYDAGGSRVDRDRDGFIDAPGAAVLDQAWQALTTAGLCDRLGTKLCTQLDQDHNSRYGRSQYNGWQQYMWKDFRRMLGQSVKGKYSTTYCAKGNVKTCASELWAALDGAAKSIGAVQGSDPSAWRRSTASELIQYSPLPLLQMQWTNRPSGIHQVMQFGG